MSAVLCIYCPLLVTLKIEKEIMHFIDVIMTTPAHTHTHTPYDTSC